MTGLHLACIAIEMPRQQVWELSCHHEQLDVC